ncbi:sulfatase-like hydrolase/transferase [Roseovarius sp. M141]|uniref:sulfatase-like hydrolase/transferase n=1 Tax=Roseovarius sp. M141 TaxID=2583806 RepID=UPI003380F2AF|nr:hypothetical protein [Roseovarius sp. M141]
MNVLFITADQWRGECLSCLGSPPRSRRQIWMPLAADGITFKRHFAQATPCGPSRACLYTGMYMQNHRSVLNGYASGFQTHNVWHWRPANTDMSRCFWLYRHKFRSPKVRGWENRPTRWI